MKPFHIFVPNLLNVCIDEIDHEEFSGRLYHCYTREPIRFASVVEVIREAEKMFDAISFPQASTKTRCFMEKESVSVPRPEKVTDQKDVAAHKGAKGSFLICVRFRQNSTWQGDFRHEESGAVESFSDIVELIKKIDQILR